MSDASASRVLCKCGCGREVKPGRSYLRAHAGHEAIRKRGAWGSRLWTIEDRGFETPCWIWKGSKNKSWGYGRTTWKGRSWPAHVRAWIESGHDRVPGMHLDHLCKERACVNPEHLEQVTPAENAHRSSATKLTWETVREIRARYAAGGISQPQLACEYDVSQANIWLILAGKTWV